MLDQVMKNTAILLLASLSLYSADNPNIKIVTKTNDTYNYSISWLNGRNDCVMITVRPKSIKEMPTHCVHITNGVGDYLYFDDIKCGIGHIVLSGFAENKTDSIDKFPNIVKAIEVYGKNRNEFYKLIESDILRLGLTSR
jgi:hypothetical protein